MADRRSGSSSPSEYRTPLWVKVFGLIVVVIVLLFLILLFTRGPHRGPGGHMMRGHTPSGSSHR